MKVIHLNRAKILSSAKMRKFTDVYMLCILWHFVVKYKLKLYRNYLKQFPQTLSFCYIMPTSISIFLCPSKVSVLVHFQESLIASNTISHTFSVLNSPDKKTKQNSSKTKQHLQQQQANSSLPTNRRQRTRLFLARGHRDFALIG